MPGFVNCGSSGLLKLIDQGRKRTKNRFFYFMKNICTGIFLSLQRSCIVLFQEYRYGAVEFFQTKELLFTQRSKYPCIYNTYRIFNQCFVFGMVGSGRQDRGTVMRGKIQ